MKNPAARSVEGRAECETEVVRATFSGSDDMSFKDRLDIAKYYQDRIEAARRQLTSCATWALAILSFLIVSMKQLTVPHDWARLYVVLGTFFISMVLYAAVVGAGREMICLDKDYHEKFGNDQLPRLNGIIRAYRTMFISAAGLVVVALIAVVMGFGQFSPTSSSKLPDVRAMQ